MIRPALLATIRLTAPISLAAVLAGCGSRVAYSPPVLPPSQESVSLQASFDDSWNAVIQTFFEKNIPVRTLERASGLLESDELHGEIGRDCDCGSYLGIPVGGYAGAYGGDAYFRFRVLVERRGERETNLVVRSSCRARVERVEGDLVCRLAAPKEDEVRAAIQERAAHASRPANAPKERP